MSDTSKRLTSEIRESRIAQGKCPTTPWAKELPALLQSVRSEPNESKAIEALDSFVEEQVTIAMAIMVARQHGVDLTSMVTEH